MTDPCHGQRIGRCSRRVEGWRREFERASWWTRRPAVPHALDENPPKKVEKPVWCGSRPGVSKPTAGTMVRRKAGQIRPSERT